MVQHKISELPLDERPSYKIEKHPQAMSHKELLALVIGGENQMDIAEQCMQSCGAISESLGRTPFWKILTGSGKPRQIGSWQPSGSLSA